MSTRSYEDPCGTARALDVIGERWTLLVVRELIFGPKRFTQLSRGLPSMSQNVLSQRLRDLELQHVVRQRQLGPPASTRVYELTARGRDLKPVLIALGRWGSRVPLDPDSNADLSVDALMLALMTTFVPERAKRADGVYELRIDGDRFRLTIDNGSIDIARSETDDASTTVEATAPSLRSLVFGGRALADAERADDVRITGDRSAAEAFVRCFPRPVPFAEP